MKIDIAIVNYRSAPDTLEALARLSAWTHGTVWVVDNSAHETERAQESDVLYRACAAMATAEMLHPGENLGFGRACNLAFARSEADFFLLLNPDARIGCEDILRLAQALAERPQLGAVSPKIFWNVQHSFVLPAAFPQTPSHSVALALASRSQRMARWAALGDLRRATRQMAAATPFEVGFLAGAVLLLRRSAAQAAGGLFDPDFFMFFEDSDLSLRLRRAGFGLAVVPEAVAVHEYRHKAFKGSLMAESQQLYFEKQYPGFFHFSRKLRWVAALSRPIKTNEWFEVMAEPVTSAGHFSELAGGRGVLAFSPSLLMLPALFRPSLQQARCFDDQEWALLEPASYTALVAPTDPACKPSWVFFERAGGVRPGDALNASFEG